MNVPLVEVDSLVIDDLLSGSSHLTATDHVLNGRTVRLDGCDIINFRSCSYLGLERDDRLRDGVIDAVYRYGTQFALGAHLSAPPYAELEELLSRIMDGPALCLPTTLDPLAALSLIVDPGDEVIVDEMTPSGVQLVSVNLQLQRQPEILPHNCLDVLEEWVGTLGVGSRVWYFASGVYSLHGDFLPVGELDALLERCPRLHLYIDDSHGLSWQGARGSGSVIDDLGNRDRVVVAASLEMAFASSGAVITCGDPEIMRHIRTCHETMQLGGQIPPPMVGAAMASAHLHLSPEIDTLQAELRARIELRNAILGASSLPVMSDPRTPICCVDVGDAGIAYRVVARLLEEGFLTSPVVFPTVLSQRAAVRFTLTRHHTFEDMQALVAALEYVVTEEMERAGSSLKDTDSRFSRRRQSQG